LGKNLETIINKALVEENPEKRNGFANSIAYYMKLAYNTWHKEVVHDDAIRSELNIITAGQLEFTNTPNVKSFRPVEKERNDYNRPSTSSNAPAPAKRNQKFQFQRRENRDSQGNDNRGSGNRGNDNRSNDRGGNKYGNNYGNSNNYGNNYGNNKSPGKKRY
jgi:Domain of unknown function (DUF4290)